MLEGNWNRVQPGQGTNAVTAYMDPAPEYGLEMQLRLANNHGVEEVP